MSADAYVYESIDVEPPISEAELEAKLASDDYRKITWDDPRLGDGYFVQVGTTGTLGIAAVPVIADDGTVIVQGIAIQANPLSDDHLDEGLDDELRKIIVDFGEAPDGVKRLFARGLYIEKPDGDEKLVVRDGQPVRLKTD